MVRKYYATRIGDTVKKIISPLIQNPLIADLVKGWSSFVPEWAMELTPSQYVKQTKVLWINASAGANLLALQYKAEELRTLINMHLGYIAVLSIKIKSV